MPHLIRGLFASLTVASLLCGCALEGLDPDEGGDLSFPEHSSGRATLDAELEPDAGTAPTSFDFERLLEDDQLLGGEEITTAIVQQFLDDQGSFLAGYNDPIANVSAAEIITTRSHAYGVSPLYMLARIQTESSLVSSGSSSNLDAATGCGCPDGLGCNPDLGGFGNQVECAAMKLRGYYNDLDAGNPTIAGWNVGEPHTSLDPCEIVPANKATAALYTYTPWVGAYADECGRTDIGGSSLVALAYYRFAFAHSWPGVE